MESLRNFFIKNKHEFVLPLILLFGFVLLIFNISERTFWMDETMALNFLPFSVKNFFIYYFSFPVPENHAPLYYLLVLLINKITFSNELFVRLPSVLVSLGIVYLIYHFSILIFKDRRWAYLSTILSIFSSYFILIGQMARYHSLAALVTITTLFFFFKVEWNLGTKKDLYLFILFYIILSWTDFPHFFYFALISNIYFFYKFFRNKSSVISISKWLIVQIVVAISFLPLVWMMYNRIVLQGDGGFLKHNLLGNGILNFFVGVLMYIYDFFFGENIFPWNWSVFIPGVIVLLLVFYFFLKNFVEFNKEEKIISLLFIAAVSFFTIFISFANARYNALVYPKYGYAAYPLWILFFTVCLKQMNQKLRYACVITYIIVASYGLWNFYHLTNYLNASYFRTFESFEFVKNNSQNGQYIAISPDASSDVYNFYKAKYFNLLQPFPYGNLDSTKRGTQVWFFTTASDALTESVTTDSNIPKEYKVMLRYDSVPLDPTFKKVKEIILHRPSYTYKYTVFLLEKI